MAHGSHPEIIEDWITARRTSPKALSPAERLGGRARDLGAQKQGSKGSSCQPSAWRQQTAVGMVSLAAGLAQSVAGLDQSIAGLDQSVAGLNQCVAGLDQMTARLAEMTAGNGR